ncbi:polysaccharide lyase family 8 super-sandwich domain-containing protein [Lacticaseibacillus manihotivorans]|nr:polysaccharide lyase family 8 super-sandwich domain-containing protein [Lacticaseibacillus manihotivorans]
MEKVVRFKLHKHKKQWLTIGVVTVAGVVISVTTTTQVSANTETQPAIAVETTSTQLTDTSQIQDSDSVVDDAENTEEVSGPSESPQTSAVVSDTDPKTISETTPEDEATTLANTAPKNDSAISSGADTIDEATATSKSTPTSTLTQTSKQEADVAIVAAPDATNLATGKSAKSSWNGDSSHSADMAIDGDKNSRWAGQQGEENGDQTLTVDLGKADTVSEVDIKFESETTDYEVLTSVDGIDYTKVFGVTNGEKHSNIDKVIVFDPVQARYVQYHQLSNWQLSSNKKWYASSIYELNIYRTKQALTALSISPADATMSVGTQRTLVPTITPKNLVFDSSRLVWTSSDESVATVVNGKVTANQLGTATISVKDSATGLSSQANISVVAQRQEYVTMRERWRDRLMPESPDTSDPNVKDYLTTIAAQSDELWQTMDTSSNRDRLWEKVSTDTESADMTTTFKKIKTLTLGYYDPLSKQYQDPEVYNAIVDALDFMVTTKKYNGTYWKVNWWDWNIGSSQPLIDTLMLLYPDLKQSAPDKLVEFVTPVTLYDIAPDVPFQTEDPTGANLTDVGISVLGSGLLLEDDTRVALVQAQLPEVLSFSTSGDGMYADGSFIQHKQHAYNGAYGSDMLRGIARIVTILQDTPWAISDDQLSDFYQFVDKGYLQLMVEGRMPSMFNGRTISRTPLLNQDTSELESGREAIVDLAMIATFAPKSLQNKIYQEIDTWIEQVGSAYNFFSNARDYEALTVLQKAVDANLDRATDTSVLNIYGKMDRVLQRTPTYSVALSLYSKRISSFEAVNTENKHGWHISDGMLYLYNGDLQQFGEGYWPTVDPYRLPGTTVDTLPLENASGSGRKSPESWVGGATDTKIAAIGMALNKAGTATNLVAKKSWFLLNGQIVNLGAGITGSTTADIETIVDDRQLTTPETYVTVDGAAFVNGSHVNQWANINTGTLANNIGYIIASSNHPVNISEASRTGKYSDINSQFPSEKEYTFDYLTVAINHGAKITDGTYEYVTVPGATDEQIAELATKPIYQVLSNTSDLQAIQTGNQILANAWTSADDIAGLLSVDHASSLVVTALGGGDYEVSVSDPTQSNEAVTLTFKEGVTLSADDAGVFSVKGTQLIFDSDGQQGASQTVLVHLGALVDKSQLGEAMTQAEKIDTSRYVPSTLQQLAKALRHAKSVFTAQHIEQASVNQATSALRLAITGLKLKQTSTKTAVHQSQGKQTYNSTNKLTPPNVKQQDSDHLDKLSVGGQKNAKAPQTGDHVNRATSWLGVLIISLMSAGMALTSKFKHESN